jgi:hypothetical protein
MQANTRWGGHDDGFLDAESLALRIVGSGQTAPVGTGRRVDVDAS